MSYTDNAKNLMLDALKGTNPTAFITHASLHTAFPGGTGIAEVTGGSPAYARKSVTFNAAAAGNLDSSNTPLLDVPASTTVGWLGFFSAVTAGTFLAYAPLGGNPIEYTVDVALDKIEATAHGYVNDDTVVFIGGTPPGGLTEGTIYFVVGSTANDFQVAATQGGAAIDLTTVGDGSVEVSKIVEETFAAQGTLTVSDADLNLNG